MIFDKIENLVKYAFDLQFILEDLLKGNFESGRYNIEGDNKLGIDLAYKTIDGNKALWEAHRKYLDIHVIIEGEEIIQVADISTMVSSKAYKDDYELFEGKPQHTIHLKKGDFLILFPNEVHKTGLKVGGPISVKKKVYKLMVGR